ncbi:hypothetical protein SBRCBS47491_001183 [Sporothrix bragantina]|uniref:Uncharacterized protein n=1 Tax=Sporothrix bragantina TaxID=671064 RepID=A0ABP0AWH4_9PEZI
MDSNLSRLFITDDYVTNQDLLNYDYNNDNNNDNDDNDDAEKATVNNTTRGDDNFGRRVPLVELRQLADPTGRLRPARRGALAERNNNNRSPPGLPPINPHMSLTDRIAANRAKAGLDANRNSSEFKRDLRRAQAYRDEREELRQRHLNEDANARATKARAIAFYQKIDNVRQRQGVPPPAPLSQRLAGLDNPGEDAHNFIIYEDTPFEGTYDELIHDDEPQGTPEPPPGPPQEQETREVDLDEDNGDNSDHQDSEANFDDNGPESRFDRRAYKRDVVAQFTRITQQGINHAVHEMTLAESDEPDRQYERQTVELSQESDMGMTSTLEPMTPEF